MAVVRLHFHFATIVKYLDAIVGLLFDISCRIDLETNFADCKLRDIEYFPLFASITSSSLLIVIISQEVMESIANVVEFLRLLFHLDGNFGEVILLTLMHDVRKVVKRKIVASI